jgi:hypothetical protein
MTGPVRSSARVIVVDDDGCVLLVRALDELDDKPPFWITPLQSEDWYFGLRAQRFAPMTDGYTELEGEVLGTWHWWTPEELAAPSEIVIPKDLLEVVSSVLQQTHVIRSPAILPWTPL